VRPALVIFDCDGVLIDSEIVACGIEAEMLTEVGYPVSVADVAERFMGRPTADMVRTVEAALGHALPGDFLARLNRRIVEGYRGRLKAVDGAAQAIAAAPAPVCVASSSEPAKLFTGLIESGLIDAVYPNVFSTVLVKRGKPEPDLFLHAADRMGAAPEHCIVVEDSVPGVMAGKAAGMTVIGFTGGAHVNPDHGARLRAAGADDVVPSHPALSARLAAFSSSSRPNAAG